MKAGLAMVGCGWGSRCLYAPYFKHLENGELVAVVDRDQARAEQYAKVAGVRRVYNGLAPLLVDKDVDAVMILTPPALHAEQVERCAAAGKHVYCEKPMARDVSEADRIIGACARHNVKLQVAFMKRFNASFRLVKSLLDEGRLGEVFEMRAIWDNARAGIVFHPDGVGNYRHKRSSGGGYLQEDGSHPIDVCRWFLGDVEEVNGYALLVAADRFENEDVATVTMKHKSGAISTLHITMLTHKLGEESYEVFGTKGTLHMRWPCHSTRTCEPADIKLYRNANTVTDLTLPSSWNTMEELLTNWQYLNELKHFCDCILNDRKPAVTGADGRAVVEIINAAYISSWEKRRVQLPLDKVPDFETMFKSMAESCPFHMTTDDAWLSRY